ncbi:hypothetical protein N5J77_28470 [Sphingobium yanoikuyae]|uniref:Uncharacterized protein n=1 Tax=Sphingobium yanoikuyae TaxID=13690 RepID=A0AA42X316_SPHYA|nr:hypothetical protein [Sphingobium yanoikuyae]MDH2135066.1 hypothetical protein [Sphingobium yanoikuyae]MDH2153103.1 hypothetical protein [Sphingobium yanoikuyae]MDH2170381.1 hypothetical protein [Sphingobium yanoikuyae]
MSETSVGQKWLAQFATPEQPAAAAMLDAMLLLNEEQVSTAIRGTLDKIAENARHRGKRIALYAEREFQHSVIFSSELLPDRHGKLRRRAVGRSGPPAVKPIRGRSRVGSEGLIAFLASQQKDAWPKIFMNHPGPDLLRGKTAPAGEVIILTDFIGSGNRVRSMLDKFWAVPTVRSWVSRRLLKFRVVAAAATNSGLIKVRSHRLRPEVVSEWISPIIDWATSPLWYFAWRKLMDTYGPPAGRGSGRYGFGGEAALIAFSYRIPNNTPAIIHQSEGAWRALYDGPIPPTLSALFGVRTIAQIIGEAASDNGIVLPPSLTEEERKMVVVLSLLRGRWHRGSETALAARSGMAVPPLMDMLREALAKALITNTGRLTDKGYAFLEAGGVRERKTPVIATTTQPYYPEALRVPR